MEFWQELIITVCVGGTAGILGGFIGISLSARSEIRRRRASEQRIAQRQRIFTPKRKLPDLPEPPEPSVAIQGKKDGEV